MKNTKKATITALGFGAILLALTATAPTASAVPPPGPDCVTLTTGERACGIALTPVPCEGSATGAATGLVDWELRILSTPGGPASYYSLGASPAYAGAGLAAECWTNSCTFAELYANGQLVTRSQGVCWEL